MSTWARTADGDIVLPPIGQGASALVTDPDQCCAIKLTDRFNFWKGEWFLDTSQGFPWQAILGQKRPNVVAIRQLFRKAILETAPVVSVDDLGASYDPVKRDLRYLFAAHTDRGAVLQGGPGARFVVTSPSPLAGGSP